MKSTSLLMVSMMVAVLFAASACTSKKTTSDMPEDVSIVAPAAEPSAPAVEAVVTTPAPDATTKVASLGASSSGRSR